MRRPIPLIATLALLALSGCGGGGSSTSTSASTASGSTSTASTATSTPTGTSTQSSTSTQGAGQSTGGSGGSGGPTNANGAPLGANTAKPGQGDNSVQTYGAAATGAQRAAVISAMRAYLRAYAAFDYARICANASAKVRLGLKHFSLQKNAKGKSCAALLPKFLRRSPANAAGARAAAAAKVSAVRVGPTNAFVIFKPAGKPLNFLVMVREGGAWRALNLGAGTPLVPTG